MRNLQNVLESILSADFDPQIDYVAEYDRYCKSISHVNNVESISYNEKTGRFDVITKNNESFQVFGDVDSSVQWTQLPYGSITGVFEIAHTTVDIEKFPTSCGGFAAYGVVFTGSKPHKCEIIDYTPGSTRIYRGGVEIVKTRGEVTKFKNRGKLTFDVSKTDRIKGEVQMPDYGGIKIGNSCRIQPNAQKPDTILKCVEIVGN